MTRARACVVRRSNVLECVSTMTRMFCSMHAGLLDGRCLGRRYRVSLELVGLPANAKHRRTWKSGTYEMF